LVPRVVYFDRSAYDGAVKAPAKRARILEAVRAGAVRIIPSTLVLEETTPVLTAHAAAAHVHCVAELADWHGGVAKEPRQAFFEQADAALRGLPSPPIIRPPLPGEIAFLERSAEIPAEEVQRVASAMNERKGAFFEAMSRDRDRAKRFLKEHAASLRPSAPGDFAAMCARYSLTVVSALGLKLRSEDDVRRVLSAPAVKWFGLLHVHYVTRLTLKPERDRKKDLGDGYDLLHACAALAADEFVTRDRDLLALMRAAAPKRPSWSFQDFVERL
jgi:hypothetical protein